MDKEYRDLITAMTNGYGYDYVANHYTEFTKEELKDIILECLYAINNEYTEADVAGELEDIWNY